MNKSAGIAILIVLFTFGQPFFCTAQVVNHEVEPQGIFKTIDVARHNKAISTLKDGNEQEKQQTVNTILKDPNYYNPPVIYALSRELFNEGKKDEAAYWFYVAQLRARYDANLCMDNSAKQGVSVLNSEYGPAINTYAMQDIDKLENIVKKVVEFVKTNTENYDHRWINLHGMWAMMSGLDEKNQENKELSQPKAKWPEIKKKTIDDYYNGFVEAMKSQKK